VYIETVEHGLRASYRRLLLKKPLNHPMLEHIAAILWTPNDVVVTGIHRVNAGLAADAIFRHAAMILNQSRITL